MEGWKNKDLKGWEAGRRLAGSISRCPSHPGPWCFTSLDDCRIHSPTCWLVFILDSRSDSDPGGLVMMRRSWPPCQRLTPKHQINTNRDDPACFQTSSQPHDGNFHHQNRWSEERKKDLIKALLSGRRMKHREEGDENWGCFFLSKQTQRGNDDSRRCQLVFWRWSTFICVWELKGSGDKDDGGGEAETGSRRTDKTDGDGTRW